MSATAKLCRECIIALALGVTTGLAVVPVGVAKGGQAIVATVALTMVLVVVVGIMLPFMLYRFRLDPATAGAPLVTTIADVLGVVIYFTIATALLVQTKMGHPK